MKNMVTKASLRDNDTSDISIKCLNMHAQLSSGANPNILSELIILWPKQRLCTVLRVNICEDV